MFSRHAVVGYQDRKCAILAYSIPRVRTQKLLQCDALRYDHYVTFSILAWRFTRQAHFLRFFFARFFRFFFGSAGGSNSIATRLAARQPVSPQPRPAFWRPEPPRQVHRGEQATADCQSEAPAEDTQTSDGKDPAAIALGRRGGKKGGPAWAEKLSKRRLSEIAGRAARA